MAIDEAQEVLNLLSASWNSSNTNSITPEFSLIYYLKRLNSSYLRSYSTIYTYTRASPITATGISGVDREIIPVSIDIRTDGHSQANERDHLLKLRDEVKRIIRLNYGKKIASKYDKIQIINGIDLSDKMKKLYRYVLDIELTIYDVNPS